MKNQEYTFKDYANQILPRKIKMLESLIPNAFEVSKLFKKGSGERGVIKKLGRIDDFKGIYAFIDQGKVIYVGASEKVINRLIYQTKGHTKYQAHLAWELAKSEGLWVNKKLEIPDLDKAKKKIMKMQLIFMEITSPIERSLLEIYAAMYFECPFNYFESH
ncbi:MAG: hypothetical protein R3345_06670 [Fulvivirga sp.]|nr:hypothetical protein [Fulvivirga sp.]